MPEAFFQATVKVPLVLPTPEGPCHERESVESTIQIYYIHPYQSAGVLVRILRK